MDKLIEQETVPAGLADLLVSIYEDGGQDVVMRDYAVQHITPAYAQCNPQEKAALRNALWKAVKEKDSSLAGTALIALEELSRNAGVASAVPAEFDRGRVSQAAMQLAGDDTCGELARITALSICARMGIKQVLPVATQLAENAHSVPLRIAAIAALGDADDETAVNLLQQISTGSDSRLQVAVQAALARAKKHNGN